MDLNSYRLKNTKEKLTISEAFNRKNGVFGYNYNIPELKEMFAKDGFRGFIQRGKSLNGPLEYGGFMVITDKQYILGYNAGLGQGTHTSAYAACLSELKGGDKIHNDNDLMYLSSVCQKNFITVRFVYEKNGRNQYGTFNYVGRILFDFGKVEITPGKLQALENFYNEYSRELKAVCEENIFHIYYSYVDGTSYFQPECKSLDDVLNFARRRLNTEAENTSSEDEVIIGVPNEPVKSL